MFSPPSPILLVEPPDIEERPDVTIEPTPVAPTAVAPGGLRTANLPESGYPSSTVPTDPMFGPPGLAVLATISLLEAYRWLGVIANRGSRPWAAAFAVLTIPAALALARQVGGRRRAALQRLVVLASVGTALATAAVLWNDHGWPSTTMGIADLGLAAAALVALVAGERSRRRGHGTP